jgi:hypothetical protein
VAICVNPGYPVASAGRLAASPVNGIHTLLGSFNAQLHLFFNQWVQGRFHQGIKDLLSASHCVFASLSPKLAGTRQLNGRI